MSYQHYFPFFLKLTGFLFKYLHYVAHFAVLERRDELAIVVWKILDSVLDSRHKHIGTFQWAASRRRLAMNWLVNKLLCLKIVGKFDDGIAATSSDGGINARYLFAQIFHIRIAISHRQQAIA